MLRNPAGRVPSPRRHSPVRRRVVWAGPLALVMLGACGAPPLQVVHLERLDPPATYRVWWDELERCVGWTGDFEGIEWFTGDAVRLEGNGVFGAWQAPRTIVVKRFYSTSQRLVKHEMLHYLTRGDMPHTHPAFATCT